SLLNEFQSHVAAHRFGLLRHPDGPHATLAKFLEKLVVADLFTGPFTDHHRRQHKPGILQKFISGIVGAKERIDLLAQFRFVLTRLRQESLALQWRSLGLGLGKQFYDSI